MRRWQSWLLSLFAIALVFGKVPSAWAFPGLYVGGANAELYNHTAQVAIARDGKHTTLTMRNDYEGSVADLALVITVPANTQSEQVRVVDTRPLNALIGAGSPALRHDPLGCIGSSCLGFTPCFRTFRIVDPYYATYFEFGPEHVAYPIFESLLSRTMTGEYDDIAVLNAQESQDIRAWLQDQGYQISSDIQTALKPYIRQGMSFVVAQVNIPAFEQGQIYYLPPLQITYSSPQLMLPIRLGRFNAKAVQDLQLSLLTPAGRTEVSNYRTVPIPNEALLPEFVEDNFDAVYQAIIQKSYERSGRNTVFLGFSSLVVDSCQESPCWRRELANTPNLRAVGASWLPPIADQFDPGANVFVTGLHVHSGLDDFPEDLFFDVTQNQQRFEVKYNTMNYEVSDSGVSEKTAEQCASDIVSYFQERHEYLIKRRQRDPDVNVPTDFSTYLRIKLAPLADPSSRNFRHLLSTGVFTVEDLPLFTNLGNPFAYVFQLSQTVFTLHEIDVTQRLKEESRTLSQQTGWPLNEIRHQITAEQEVPESWRQQYPAS